MMKQRQINKLEPRYKKFGKHSDSEEDENELFTIKKPTPRREQATVEKVVEEGDTLQSLAIRYYCSIEDLKRLNNIHKENEIFAKRTIRVPHHPISMALAGVHVSGRSSPNQPSTSGAVDGEQLTASLQETEVNQIIFNTTIATKSPSERDDSSNEDDEVVHLIAQQPEEPMATKINCSGVDGDISLKALVLCIVVLIFAVPLIYVLYIAEHPQQFHHNNHGS